MYIVEESQFGGRLAPAVPAQASRDRLVTVLETEAAAITQAAQNADLLESIAAAVDLIVASREPLIVSGVGKSGHIGRKLAATFASLGKRSLFVHPTEASHGDLGMIMPGAPLLVLSNSGESRELGDLLGYAAANGNPVIGLTASRDSTLGRASCIVLAHGKHREACCNGLAPTTSTTLALAIGDALAVATSQAVGFRPEDFRKFHPGGSLGARLNRVASLTHPIETCPSIAWDAPLMDAACALAADARGFLVIRASINQEPIGLLTSADLRGGKIAEKGCSAAEIGTLRPLSVDPDLSGIEACAAMVRAEAEACFVRQPDQRLVGVLRLVDCS